MFGIYGIKGIRLVKLLLVVLVAMIGLNGAVPAAMDTGIQRAFDPLDYDTNEDGCISKTEALNAIVDYFDNQITKAQALEVIVLYFGGCTPTYDLEMVSIPGGSFQMGDLSGDGDSDELPVHTVTLSPFSMAKYELTYEKWMEVKTWAESNGYTFNMPGDMGSEDYGGSQDETHPVTGIEWYDAVLWCNALSEKEGLTPCYYTNASHTTVYRSGRTDIENNWVDWNADGYRLPTEAEWEYACRADTTTKYSFGNSIDGNDANYQDSGDSYDNGTTPVGYYPANPWGLYDMHGNVWEWCWDWYDSDYYNSSPSTDPRGPSACSNRVNRGGSWCADPVYLRSASRSRSGPGVQYYIGGFRPVRPSS